MGRPSIPVAEKFWANVDKRGPDECWLWKACGDHGYGRLRVNGRKLSAHRTSYLLNKGPVPDGLQILHSCNNRRCVNPGHLRAGTQVENMADKITAGTDMRGEKHFKAKINGFVVRVIRRSKIPDTEMAAIYGLTPSHVGKIRKRLAWRHVE